MSPDSVRNAIKALRKIGLIEAHERFDGPTQLTNFYTFNFDRSNTPPLDNSHPPLPDNGDSPTGQDHPPPLDNSHPNQEVEPVSEHSLVDPSNEGLDEPSASPSKTDQIRTVIREIVFPEYLAVVRGGQSPTIYSLTTKRLAQGVKRFQECLRKTDGDMQRAADLMLIAVYSISESDFHMGRDPKTSGKCYKEWEHIFRSAETLERWLGGAA